MILHFFNNDPNEKFNKPFIEFTNKHYEKNEHCFVIWGGKKGIEGDNIIYKCDISYISLLRMMREADKIVFHQMPYPQIIFLVGMSQQLPKKTFWVIWGGDLHYKTIAKESVRNRIIELFRIQFIKKIYGVCTLVDEDYITLKEWYVTDAKRFDGLYAMDERVIDYIDSLNSNRSYIASHNGFNVLLGNSASISNHHIEAIDIIKNNRQVEKVYCPLVYGDKKNREKVIQYGKRIFQEHFVPITEFIDVIDYVDLLNNIDMGVFNNDRQQGLGNIYLLLLLKKQVFMRNDTTMWNQLVKKEGYRLHSIDELITYNESTNSQDAREYNYLKMKYRNSEENQMNVWGRIYNEKPHTAIKE